MLSDPLTEVINRSAVRIAPGKAPFALVGREHRFDSDDWAWQFLRLSASYRAAYAEAARRQSANPGCLDGAGPHLRDRREQRTVFVNERLCRKFFGLSTWLPPDQPVLPRLHKGESWFWPLRMVVYDSEFEAGAGLQEGIYGFSAFDPKGGPQKCYSRRFARDSASIWFAVDCSVPPAAQLASIKFVIRRAAERLRQVGETSQTFCRASPIVRPLVGDPRFDAEDYQYGAAVGDGVDNMAEVWRLLRVDVLGAAQAQLAECQSLLLGEHRELVRLGLAKPPEQERLRLALASTNRIEFGDRPTDGHALKAYVIIALCRLNGITDAPSIVERIEGLARDHTSSARQTPEWDNWLAGRIDRFEGYLDKALHYVDGGYKWLVHAQKP